jgi:molybdopterin adenylyltransferase
MSGRALVERLTRAGHTLVAKIIVPDDMYKIRAVVSGWIADETVQIILITGGTGLTGRDVTPEAIRPLLDREIEGFGELFRWISYREIKASTVQSRAFAGIANGTIFFCMPGSVGACRTAWDDIISEQLDARERCSFMELLPRLRENIAGLSAASRMPDKRGRGERRTAG